MVAIGAVNLLKGLPQDCPKVQNNAVCTGHTDLPPFSSPALGQKTLLLDWQFPHGNKLSSI